LFGLLRQTTPHALAAITAFTLIASAMYFLLASRSNSNMSLSGTATNIAIIDREANEPLIPKVESKVYSVHKFPKKKGFEFLRTNPDIEAIVESIRVVRMFDRARYQELLLTLNNMQKTYVYILGKRVPYTVGVSSFFDQRDAIMELMYSFYMVTPRTLKHVYGMRPYQRLQEAIERLFKLTDTMTSVLRNFVLLELHQPWPYDHFIVPANRMSNQAMP